MMQHNLKLNCVYYIMRSIQLLGDNNKSVNYEIAFLIRKGFAKFENGQFVF